MGQINTRGICLLGPTTVTTSGTGPDIVLIQAFQAAIITATLSTTSGTLPTFDIYLQKRLEQPAATDVSGGLPSGTPIYDDLLHFTQLTTNSSRIAQLVTGPQSPTANATVVTTADWLQSDAALTAGDIRIGPLGGAWRIKYVITGTTPSTVLSVTAQLIPFST